MRNLVSSRLLTCGGKKLWEHKTTVAPLSLTAGPDGIYFRWTEAGCTGSLQRQCDLEYGPGRPPFKIPFNFGLKIVVRKDLVLAPEVTGR